MHPRGNSFSLRVPLTFPKVNLRWYIVCPKALLTFIKVNPKWYRVHLMALHTFLKVKLKCFIIHLKALLTFHNKIHMLLMLAINKILS